MFFTGGSISGFRLKSQTWAWNIARRSGIKENLVTSVKQALWEKVMKCGFYFEKFRFVESLAIKQKYLYSNTGTEEDR